MKKLPTLSQPVAVFGSRTNADTLSVGLGIYLGLGVYVYLK